MDIRVGWLRNNSAINADSGEAANPAGTLLYVDDLVVDAVSSGSPAPPTIAISRDAAGITITYTGTLESSADVATGYAAVQGATNPFVVSPDQAQRFYRTKN